MSILHFYFNQGNACKYMIMSTTEAIQMGQFQCLAISFGSWLFCNAGLTLWRIYGEWAYECSSPCIRNDRK